MSFSEFAELKDEIGRITTAAAEVNIPLRVFGGAAMRLHCPMHQQLYDSLERSSNHDMDFVTYDGLGEQTRMFFTRLGYDLHVSMALSGATGTGRHRQTFYDRFGNKAADVCLGTLKMSYVIDLSRRLEVDFPTVPLAELALQKLQIVEMREKDLQDMVILLCAHDVGHTDDETINSDLVAKTLAKNWGFHYTATTNLRRIAEYAANHPVLSNADKNAVVGRVKKLMHAIDAEPKTPTWKLRARVGTAVKWYNVVEQVQP
jgi:hypothetical protein